MSMKKIMTPDEIRVELARRRMSRRELAECLGLSRDYVCRIILGLRNAESCREQIKGKFTVLAF